MKRFSVYALGLILAAAAALAIILAVDNSKDHKSSSSGPSNLSATTASKQACSIFTLADAKPLLGASAKGGVNPIYDNPQADLSVTSCTYSQDSGSNAPVSSNKTASLLVHAPTTPAGAQSNVNQFTQVKPADAESVSGYGDSAYWDAKHGQLDILKNNSWYILTFGPVTPSDRSLEQTKQLADSLIDKL
jgi:hypothetical protein